MKAFLNKKARQKKWILSVCRAMREKRRVAYGVLVYRPPWKTMFEEAVYYPLSTSSGYKVNEMEEG